jgi:Ca2+-binding EF-hand superfamily protein
MLIGIGVKATAQELRDLLTDVVGDEPKVDFNAFVVLMTRKYKQLSFDEEVDGVFKVLDQNKNTFTDGSDIVALMQSRGIVVTPGEAQSLLAIISDSAPGMTKEELKTFIHTKM